MEVLFYHLTRSRLEDTLPDLLERCLARDWRAVVQAGNAARVAALDTLLWCYRDDSFLPHGVTEPERQPVFLTSQSGNSTGAEVLMLVDGARFDPAAAGRAQRVCVVFNGQDDSAVSDAREDWKRVQAAELKGTYWAQGDRGWEAKASTESASSST